jgi:tetratricopeptide (TPR) repeat protein
VQRASDAPAWTRTESASSRRRGDTLPPIVRRAVLLAAVTLALAPAAAAAEWRELRTAHFRVIGDLPAARLREVAFRFEQFRGVVTQLLPAAAAAGSAPVVVIAFPDTRSYRPFMPLAGGRTVPVDGFFVDGADVNYITINLEAGERAFPVVFHEFSHLLLNNAFPRAPLWFNEGLAEYFSTFEVTADGRVLVGKPIARHVARLRERRLTLAQVFAIGPGSREYTREGLERDLLYAQAWALVHYARHAAEREFAPLERLARRLAGGDAVDDSVRATYGMDLAALDAAVQAYLRRAIFEHVELRFAEAVALAVDSEAGTLDAAHVDGWLADLLAHLQRGPEAIPLLERALRAQDDLPRALATLGVLRFRQGHRAQGLAMIERAAAAGPDVESVHFVHGWALTMDGFGDAARLERARAALERAVALHPGYPAPIQMLATVYISTGDFAKTRDLLLPLIRATPDNQDAALLLGAALLGLDEIAAARAIIGPVLARPHDEEMRERARTLLGQISTLQEQR